MKEKKKKSVMIYIYLAFGDTCARADKCSMLASEA